MAVELIGRDHHAGILRAQVARTLDSHGGLVLVTGEAGIGKTTLVTTVANQARRLGALVLSGACWDSGSAPGYWPWVQVVRGLRRATTAEEWQAGKGLAVMLGEAPPTDAADFQLFDTVTTALVAVSHQHPVIVVLDDLHWADAASVRLLEFAARHAWFERILLIGTYRDVEVEWSEHPLRALMPGLLAKATTVTLTGLDPDDVGTLMTRCTGREPDADLIAEVHRRTGGNPFFVEQTARLLHGGDIITTIPPGVRDTVARRLALLPAPVVRLLTIAAVAGHEFHRDVLAAVVATPGEPVDGPLNHAVAARLLVGLGADRFAFAQDLVRETLYDALTPDEARLGHTAIVRAVEGDARLGEHVLPTELARHAYLAGTGLQAGRAVVHLLAAARDADRRMAREESILHHRRALEVMPADDRPGRVMVALRLGIKLRHLGDRSGARAAFELAVPVARELGDPLLLARVALTLYRNRDLAEERQAGTGLLAEAHAALVRGDEAGSSDPARVMSAERLARELTIHGVARARHDEDDEALAFTLWTLHDVTWGPGTAAERESSMIEMSELGRRTGNEEMEHFALSLRWVALLELGDPRYLVAHHEFLALAERRGLPRYILATLLDRCIIATFQGRFAEAESLLDRACGHEGFDRDWAFIVNHLRWALLLTQGRFAELGELHASLDEHGHPHGRLLEAITAVQRGDGATALRHLAEFADGGVTYPRIYAPLWLRLRAQAAAASADPRLCQQARAALLPYLGQWAVSVYGCDISGPYELWCAVLDAAEKRWDEAIVRFGAARDSAEALRSRPWSLQARAGLAQALIGRGSAGDTDAAAGLLDEVRREATEIGMPHLVERLRQTRAPAQPVEAAETDHVFRFDGQVWELGYAGRTVRMPDAKGLRDLHHLLGRPGQDVAAVRLLRPESGEAVVAALEMGSDAVLDDEAVARYRRRLAQLDGEIDRAIALGDDHRAAEYDGERAALLEELRGAVGLGGRSRRLGDEAERARKAVTGRIRVTLRKLDQNHPELAAHLNATVSTGATCAYRPHREITWRR